MLNQNEVEMITPINVISERKRWQRQALRGIWTVPKFKYNQEYLEQSANQYTENLKKLSEYADLSRISPGPTYRRLYRRAKVATLLSSATKELLNGNDTIMGIANRHKYGPLHQDTIRKAYLFAERTCNHQDYLTSKAHLSLGTIKLLDEALFDASAIQHWFQEALKYYGLRNWQVKIDQSATAIDVRPTSYSYRRPTIVVPAGRKITGRRLLKLIRHEIECHVRDLENCRIIIPDFGTVVDDTVHEGHAIYEEQQLELYLFGRTRKYSMPWYVMSLDMYTNQGRPIAEIANCIYQMRLRQNGGDSEKAIRQTWVTLYRSLFRGRVNTSSSYAYFKDKAYFEGLIFARNLHHKHQARWLNLSTLNMTEITEEIARPTIRFRALPYPDLKYSYRIAHLLI